MGNTILIVGACGVGKTWLVKQLIQKFKASRKAGYGLIRFNLNTETNLAILGHYTGEMFEGSDKLSMAVAKDFEAFRKVQTKNNLFVIAEGDRFTNQRFIDTFQPHIVKILGDGAEGRKHRGSKQSEMHLKRIQTRVDNIMEHFSAPNSGSALTHISERIKNGKA